MKKTILKLGQLVTDEVTLIKGMLIMYSIDMDGNENYLFQPSKLNPKTGVPVDSYWLTAKRIAEPITISVNLPIDILNSLVTDKATGFTGTAISLLYHLNGCIHIEVKPSGIVDETGEAIKACEFDVRRLRGDKIKELTEEELNISKEKTPSPINKPKLFNR